MHRSTRSSRPPLRLAAGMLLALGLAACGGDGDSTPVPSTTNAWMASALIAEQGAATSDSRAVSCLLYTSPSPRDS